MLLVELPARRLFFLASQRGEGMRSPRRAWGETARTRSKKHRAALRPANCLTQFRLQGGGGGGRGGRGGETGIAFRANEQPDVKINTWPQHCGVDAGVSHCAREMEEEEEGKEEEEEEGKRGNCTNGAKTTRNKVWLLVAGWGGKLQNYTAEWAQAP